MSKKIRDWLFAIFVIIFLVGTGLVSLYASGYEIRLSWPLTLNRLLEKTGMIIVGSNPEGAMVYLDGQPQANFSLTPWSQHYLTTAAKIKNVPPGQYTLTLKLAGYRPLSEKVTVVSGETSYLQDLNLFRSDAPELIASSRRSTLALSPSRRYLYLPETQTILTIAGGQAKTLNLPTGTAGRWLNSNDQLLLAGQLISPNHAPNINYQDILGPGASNWYEDENAGRLYYQNNDTLNYLQLANQSSVMLINGETVLTYEPWGDGLILVALKDNRTVLQRYSPKDNKVTAETVLPTVGHYRLVAGNNTFPTLYDDQNKTLYLIDPNRFAAGPASFNNVLSWQWLDDYTLLYNNNWEIYLLDLHNNTSNLLLRFSQPIESLVWNSDNNYLVFATTDSLYAYDRGSGLATKILTAEAVDRPVLDPTVDVLYFWAKINGQAGIYRLLLQ